MTIQIFNDLQCADCREDFLSTIPTLAEDYARPGDVQLLYRHYSNSENVQQLGFYGAEAAAEQNYGWQYTYLFFRNQDEAGHFGVDQEFLDAIAGRDRGTRTARNGRRTWKRTAAPTGRSPSASTATRSSAATSASASARRAIVTGPEGTRTLQDGPSLGQIERAIEAVRVTQAWGSVGAVHRGARI